MKFRQARVRENGERECFCAWHEDRRPSLSINLEKNVAYCFAGCYSGTARGAIYKLLGYVPVNLEEAFQPTPFFDVSHIPTYTTQQGKGLSYMFARGFTADVLAAWRVTYDEQRASVVIPVTRRNGVELGLIYRTTVAEAAPKYLYSKGFRVSQCLFGTPLFSPLPAVRVYVTEGPLDCMWLWQCGFTSVVALLGCNMSAYQARLLALLGSCVVLCLDNDKAGRSATEKIASKLTALGFAVLVASLLPQYKDVQEHSSKELQEVLTQARPYLLTRLAEALKPHVKRV